MDITKFFNKKDRSIVFSRDFDKLNVLIDEVKWKELLFQLNIMNVLMMLNGLKH